MSTNPTNKCWCETTQPVCTWQILDVAHQDRLLKDRPTAGGFAAAGLLSDSTDTRLNLVLIVRSG